MIKTFIAEQGVQPHLDHSGRLHRHAPGPRRTHTQSLLASRSKVSPRKCVHVKVSLCNPRWNLARKKVEGSELLAMISTSVRDQQASRTLRSGGTNISMQSVWARWVFTERRTVPEKQVAHAGFQSSSVNYRKAQSHREKFATTFRNTSVNTAAFKQQANAPFLAVPLSLFSWISTGSRKR